MASGTPRYTVSELEQLTGISRRTIHFYVKEGVIAPPDGVAGGARYNEEHLLRLKLTRELQKSHLKLSGIKEAMDRLSLDQMRSMLGTAKSSARTWDKAALERWLEQRVASIQAGEDSEKRNETPRATGDTAAPHAEALGVQDSDSEYGAPSDRDAGPPSAWNQSFLDIAGGLDKGAAGSASQTGGRSSDAPHGITQQSWERIEIADGFEVLVRSDLLPGYQQVLRELVRLVAAGATKAKEKT